MFPPHTSSFGNGRPGLLHLSFRHQDRHLLDLAITDPPGEWFSRWAVDKNDPEAEGARWIAAHSDAFVLLVDCDSLVGPQKGQARETIVRIAERLHSEKNGKPIAVVWAKSDVTLKDSIRTSLRESFERLFPQHQEFHISVIKAHGGNQITESTFQQLWQWILSSNRYLNQDRLLMPSHSDDLFFMYRG